MSSDLAKFWNELDMPALRAQAKAAIDQDLELGLLSRWEQVEGLIQPFPRGDISLQGEELEAALAPGEKPYEDETDEESEMSADEAPAPARPTEEAARDRSPTADAPSDAADSSLTASGQGQKVELRRRRFADYKAMLATAKAMTLQEPTLVRFLEGKIHAEEKFFPPRALRALMSSFMRRRLLS